MQLWSNFEEKLNGLSFMPLIFIPKVLYKEASLILRYENDQLKHEMLSISMNIKIVKVEQLPKEISRLCDYAKKEHYDGVDKLVDEFNSGQNTFAADNEHLVLAYDDTKLIGCGGLNQQFGAEGAEPRIGRVRRFYVHPDYRMHGVGKQILAFIEQLARPDYSALCLQTDTTLAARFYQKQNYVLVENHPNYNYFKYLISTHE